MSHDLEIHTQRCTGCGISALQLYEGGLIDSERWTGRRCKRRLSFAWTWAPISFQDGRPPIGIMVKTRDRMLFSERHDRYRHAWRVGPFYIRGFAKREI